MNDIPSHIPPEMVRDFDFDAFCREGDDPFLAASRMVFQLLGWMWAISFSVAIGSYTFMAVSLIGHAVLIGAAAITVATYTVAARRPQMFLSHSRR